ncbi:N-acetylmuramoyl-L-alanine amidase family protein [Chitinilyticum piscinae]|uniref:N-acetylmuramoyl-L-alanine amidase n=1 Tax=Chitinilyticum piscinae TaxID=2866724 RepID=A0A8J7K9A5_9NEIS|nr:N-acetylmuramoyl-L-alanine amidase [Chitinilyticum piscinae]MBE9610978.1 N-acetylmuramoyl-L-alanine amidase [Chitinilyticum piscinae]
MRKLRTTLLTLALAGVFSIAPATNAARIALDIGHNLAKPGTLSAYGETEFSYNLALAKVIAQTLRNAGHSVTLIGDDGLMNELKPRAEAAAGHDLFISVHHDSMKEEFLEEWLVNGQPQLMSERFRGYSLYVNSDGPEYARSLHCASQISAKLQEAGFSPTLHHTDNIAGENRPMLDRQLGIYQANFAVLRHNTIPAILLEAGVIRHPDEAKLLRLTTYQQKIAESIATAIHCHSVF